jgi:hypothetical protein
MISSSTKQDIRQCVELLEQATRGMHNTDLHDQVELAARIRGVRKAAQSIEWVAKNNLRLTLWWPELEVGRNYEFPGDDFKAILRVVETPKLQERVLKARLPRLHAQYTKVVAYPRVMFDIR